MEIQFLAAAADADTGHVRRHAKIVGSELGFSADAIAEVEIVATKLATNLAYHHCTDGRTCINTLDGERDRDIEIVSIDSGPGIADLAAALCDHHSTTGTLGCGLGAVQRLSDEFDIFSSPLGDKSRLRPDAPMPGGTVVTSRKWIKSANGECGLVWDAIARPCQDETVCGDGHFIGKNERGLLVVVADGLGHGAKAATVGHCLLRDYGRVNDDATVVVARRQAS